jgi:hypothetical protein
MGFPKTTTEAVEYKGCHTPEAACLLLAFCTIHRCIQNQNLSTQNAFSRPGRSLSSVPRRLEVVIEYACGRFFANVGLYLSIVQSLAVFIIDKAADKKRREVEVDVERDPDLQYPNEFKCRVSVRSGKHADLIRQSDQHGLQEESNASLLESMDNSNQTS